MTSLPRTGGLRAATGRRRMCPSWTAGSLLVTLLLYGGALPAQPAQEEPASGGIEVRSQVQEVPPAPPLEATAEGLRLSLEEAVEIALARNLNLIVERIERAQSELTVFGNRGIYDLRLAAEASVSDSEAATTSALEASQREDQRLDLSVSQLTPWGGDVSINWDNSRRESSLVFDFLNPSFSSNLALSFVQPLLQDFGRLATERNLRVAQVNSAISREELERQVALTIQQVHNAYWRLIEAQEQLTVAEESLALAQELHERNKIEVEVGTRAPFELVQSEAAIALRQEEIIRSRTDVGDAADELRRLLNLPVERWDLALAATTEPLIEPLEVDLAAAIETALEERPELAQQRLNVDRLTIDAEFFDNQKRPQLDLAVRYSLDGTGGTERPRPDDPPDPEQPLIDTNLADAIDQILNQDFGSWAVQLTFAYPLQNRAARANSLIADLDLEAGQVALDDLEQQVITEVRQAARRLVAAAEQIESARASRRLQERNLEAEQKRYENGMSTSFQVTEIQEDLSQARSREVSAITSYRIALAEYYRSIGLLLEESRVELIDDVSREGGAG